MMAEGGGHGYSTAREVTVDPSLPLLLTYPAREYAAMRQTAQAHLATAKEAEAVAAVANCAGSEQLDMELVYHFEGGGVTAGECIGLSLLGGGAGVVVIFKSPTVAVLKDCGDGCSCSGPHRPDVSHSGFLFGLKPKETSVALRVLVDGNAIEAFAQGGRAQISFPGALHNTTSSLAAASGSATAAGVAGRGNWNTTVGLLSGSTPGGGTFDVGVWPLAFNTSG